MNAPRLLAVLLLAILLAPLARQARGEEIWLTDNSRLYGLITGFKGNAFEVTLPTSQIQTVPMRNVIAISFRGRAPRFVGTGTQEFVFQRGGVLRGEVLGQSGESISVLTSASGIVPVDTRKLTGLIGLPVEGLEGRRAQEMLTMDKGPYGPELDELLDRRGSRYPGVVERVDRSKILLDHETVLRGVWFAWPEVAGVRLADADKSPMPPLPADEYLRITLRDGGVFDGALQAIRIGYWRVRPVWEQTAVIPVDVNEIVSVRVMNGNVQYLSQLPVASARESQTIAPPHSYQIDRNCDGGALSIGGIAYPWGIGVHANSVLTYDVGGRFDQFRATIGLDSTAGREGTVVFRVLGDGKELYKSPVMKGSDAPAEIAISIAGVKQLALSVGDVEGNDLGDAADWGVARIVRAGIKSTTTAEAQP